VRRDNAAFEGLSPFARQLAEHLGKFVAAPILFVGSGVSRRYLNAPDWRTMLAKLAELTPRDYAYYRQTASDIPPAVAELLVIPLKERIWTPEESELRARYEDHLTRPDSALKVYITEMLGEVSVNHSIDPLNVREMELLRRANVDAIITTNYDSFLEEQFPDYKVFVGQDELVFSEPTGIGEIYKIHGSVSDPNSLVFTETDYYKFEKRNAYLAAKLLTFFAEHPIIFLGYGFNDPDVLTILASLANCLTDAHLTKFQDRLLFVSWQEGSQPAMVGTVMAAGTHSIPVHTLTVPDYVDVFSVLSALERKFPAKTLRHLKERIYSLVLDEEAQDRLHVTSIDSEGNEDIVLGVGVIAELQKHGYKGLSRAEICLDALHDGDFEPNYVVKMTLPDLLSRPGNFPLFKYLRSGGFLDSEGRVKELDLLPPRVVARAEQAEERLRPPASMRRKAIRIATEDDSLAQMIEKRPAAEVLAYFGALSREDIDLDVLVGFLRSIERTEVVDGGPSTAFAKAICIYDGLKYGPRNFWAEKLRI
jgi:hypothetical protein